MVKLTPETAGAFLELAPRAAMQQWNKLYRPDGYRQAGLTVSSAVVIMAPHKIAWGGDGRLLTLTPISRSRGLRYSRWDPRTGVHAVASKVETIGALLLVQAGFDRDGQPLVTTGQRGPVPRLAFAGMFLL